jgi:hypothetical protein
MVGTVVLVILFTLTALGVVLYAAYCEAGEDLPCKRSRRLGKTSHAGLAASPHQKGNS